MTRREFIDELIKSAKKNADTELAEVVRCNDCKFFAEDGFNEAVCTNWMKGTAPDGYCNFGVEFSDDEEDDTNA